ncbi:MAG: hypothetical protein V2B14_05625 [bacterium]
MEIFRKFFMGSHKGVSLVIALFFSIIALLITVTMLNISRVNTNQITDDKSGKLAYYAAEAGLAKANQAFNSWSIIWGDALEGSSLPKESTPEKLSNGATFWVDSIDYAESNSIVIVDIIGKYKNSSRKIRARIISLIPEEYDNYGLLTNGVLSIHGTKILQMSIHGNAGLNLTGTNNLGNNAVATQSSDPGAASPDSVSNPVGGYIPRVDVPKVSIDEYRAIAQTRTILDINQPDLNTQIMNAPARSIIYVGGTPSLAHTTNIIELCGDMQGKVIFVDSDITLNTVGIDNISNVMVISSGELTVNGSVDIGTSHEDKMDVIFACENDIILNGSREFDALFWTNGSFKQSGSSLAGKVISQDSLTFSGNFTLNSSDKLYNNGMIDALYIVSSCQQISMDND